MDTNSQCENALNKFDHFVLDEFGHHVQIL